MKKLYALLPVLAVIAVSIFAIGFKQESTVNINSAPLIQKKDIYDLSLYEMVELRRGQSPVREYSLFNISETDSPEKNNVFTKATSLIIDKNVNSMLLRNNEQNLDLIIPDAYGEDVRLLLTRVEVTSNDFMFGTVDEFGFRKTSLYDGIHYRGIIEGDQNSFASISIFSDFVMGLMGDENGNYILGSVQNDGAYTDEYIFYNDNNLKALNEFKCGVEEYSDYDFNRYSVTDYPERIEMTDNPDAGRSPVRVYFECDYDMYQKNGNNTQATGNFVTGMFNAVATIYQREYLKVQISNIAVYTSPDPYRFTSNSVDILFAFGNNIRDNFNGDLAHLLSTRTINAGGIAWINVLCEPYSGNTQEPYGRYAYSNIEPSYSNFPTYSWTVGVVAHEMGHNFGSMHTHACVWPVGAGGSLGAIDSCYFAEGNCFSGQKRSVGTIMSYCHLWSNDTLTGGGINFSRGFGQLPGDTIRLRYNQAACFGATTNSSELPVAFNLLPNYPNPFNPVTNLKFAIPEDANVTMTVYDIRGREVARLMSSRFFSQGIYTYQFDAGQYNLTSGVYFYRMDAISPAGNQSVYTNIRKMILIK